MIVLGIESTAHTFGIAILKDRKVLSNIRDSYTTKKGGMIPADVAIHHEKVYRDVLDRALSEAKIKLKDIQLIAYSASPGLGHTLRIGSAVAKSLAIKLDVPIVPVNHCIAHLEVTCLTTKAKDPVLLYCSGANTQVIAYDQGKYRIFGETLDTGIGNFLDTVARMLGHGFPGGPVLERLAKKGKNLIELPYTVKGMDLSFGGLETNLKQKIQAGKYSEEDIAFSVQELCFAMLVETAERAMAHVGKSELVLGGGVACNKRLQEMCKRMCEDRGAKFYCPDNQFLVDNPAMIAWTGMVMYKKGNVSVSVEKAGVNPYERTDDVKVTWR